MGAAPQSLPATSDNGVSGVWLPLIIDTSSIGTKIYTFTPDSGTCADIYTLTVTINQGIVLSTSVPDKVKLCENGNLIVDAGNDYPNSSYVWTWGNGNTFTGSKINIIEEGTYKLTVSYGTNCSRSYTVTASYFNKPVIVGVTVDPNKVTIIAEGENLEYSIDNISWQSSNIFDNLQQGGLYTFYVRSNGCLPVSIKIPLYKITNFFSPNGDGYNDTWKLYPEGVLEASHIIIVDKNGKVVYEKSSNAGFEWKGALGGRPLPTDSYWYILDIPKTQYFPQMKYSGYILLKNR
jgi:gliding motility-associated-like protein